MSYFDYPEPAESVEEDEYYMLFSRITDRAVEVYIAFTTEGDDEFDDIAAKLNLKYLSHLEYDLGLAEEEAINYAREYDSSLHLEIRFMSHGCLQQPGVFLIPIDKKLSASNKDFCCIYCNSSVPADGNWRVAGTKHPRFCSRSCVENWYVTIPLTQIVAEPA